MKIVSVVGARPQFIKAATVSRAIAQHNADARDPIREVIVHTGQHFDDNMSQVFFDELAIPPPHHHLGIAGLTHGAMTGRMLERIEQVLLEEVPDWVVVFGDTNSTLAAALAAAKLHIPVAHVEAGLRSFNMRMPEEINRIIADHVAKLLLCPTEEAVRNLANEGVRGDVCNVGDVMYDATLLYRERAVERVALNTWNVRERNYALCTIHRAENTDDPDRFHAIWKALCAISRSIPVVFPVHPRTRNLFPREMADAGKNGIAIVDPVSYLEMTRLEASAKAILTDSGGVQKEAFFHKVPCLTLRDETEWVETISLGWNVLCGADTERILAGWAAIPSRDRIDDSNPYGDGKAAHHALRRLLECQ
jgi:UDP-GlcNAc3NAcA epimerase